MHATVDPQRCNEDVGLSVIEAPHGACSFILPPIKVVQGHGKSISKLRISATPTVLLDREHFGPAEPAAHVDLKTILQKSAAASDADFKAAPQYNYKQREHTASGTKTSAVTMLDGTPYERLIGLKDEPLSAAQTAEESKKQKRAEAQRHAESPAQRKRRIAKYERDRAREHDMMAQLTQAFDFKLVGQINLRGFTVWDLKATPRAGYRPPNMETQVLKGMEGELWIDQASYRWVKVTAKVIHPVSIAGFLAKVQPGTQFEVEKSPVGEGIWQVTSFAMRFRAKILGLVSHNGEEADTFYDFEKVHGSAPRLK